MSKPIYKAQTRPYQDDINDLIEKGGVGSGIKGHTTPYVELNPNRPDFTKMTRVEECQWNVDKYTRLYNNAKDKAWKKKFKADLDEWKSRLEHWKKQEGK